MCRSERYDKENQCCARLCVPYLSQEAIEQLSEKKMEVEENDEAAL
jgi:hypothetical protein